VRSVWRVAPVVGTYSRDLILIEQANRRWVVPTVRRLPTQVVTDDGAGRSCAD